MIEWKLRDTFLNIATNWVRLIGESYTDQDGKDIEYYRVEKRESVIVLPIYKDLIYCAPLAFAPESRGRPWIFPAGEALKISPSRIRPWPSWGASWVCLQKG